LGNSRRNFILPEGRPALMGIVNVTPDSFSDGGVHFDTEVAITAALRMVEDGADLVDVGGESTRPGSEGVSIEEELRRTVPVVRVLAERGVAVSIDTCKAEVAEAGLDAGAVVVNDVTAFSDPRMASLCASAGCQVCLMHMQGTPRTMQANPTYVDVVAEVHDFLLTKAREAEQAGIARERIWIDPGIGFGKNLEHNLSLLKHIDTFVATGYAVLIGVSRKSFLGRLADPKNPLPADQRLPGTLAAQAIAQIAGAKIIRAHDIREARQVIDVVEALSVKH
jgi:dihydropteroate synthase